MMMMMMTRRKRRRRRKSWPVNITFMWRKEYQQNEAIEVLWIILVYKGKQSKEVPLHTMKA